MFASRYRQSREGAAEEEDAEGPAEAEVAVLGGGQSNAQTDLQRAAVDLQGPFGAIRQTTEATPA